MTPLDTGSEHATQADGLDARQRLLALRLRQRELTGGEEAVTRRRSDEAVPLSFSQEGLWFLDQLSGPGSAYNVARAVRLKGVLEPDLLERSLRALVERHESLRTTFEQRDGKAVQCVHAAETAAAALRLESFALHAATGDDDPSRARRHLARRRGRTVRSRSSALAQGKAPAHRR